MALITVQTPGGPVLYDDGLPDDAERLERERQEAEAARRMTEARAAAAANLGSVTAEDGPPGAGEMPPAAGIADPFAAPTTPSPTAASPPPSPETLGDDFFAAEQAKLGAPLPAPPPAAEDPNAPRITQDGNFKEVIVGPASGTPDLGGQAPPTPEEQKAARDRSLDKYEAGLQSEFTSTLDENPQTDAEKQDLALRRAGLHNALGEVGVIRAKEAAEAEAVARQSIAAQEAERLRLNERDAAIKRQAIETEVKYKTAHLDAADEEAANQKIDRSWGGGSTGRAVMLGVMAAIAGLGSALKGQGDKNPALDVIMKSIDERVADQFAQRKAGQVDRDRQRSRLDVYRNSRVLTIDQQMTAARIALMKQSANEMEQVAATLPPAKKAAVSEAAKKLREDAMSVRAGLDKRFFEETKFKMEQAEKERAAKADEANARISANASRTSAGAAWKNAVTTGLRLDWEKEKWDSPDVVAARKADTDLKVAKAEAALRAAKTPDEKKIAETEFAQIKARNAALERGLRPMTPELQKDAAGNLIMEVGEDGVSRPKVALGAALLMKDGATPVELIGNDHEKGVIRNLQSSVRQSVELIDDINNLIAENGGWDSKTLQSASYKEKLAKLQALHLENISIMYGMGVPNGKDDERAAALHGGDVNQFRSVLGVGDPRAGLRVMRDVTERKFANLLKSKSTFDGDVHDLHIPENTKAGQKAELASKPSGGIVKDMEGRIGSGVDAPGSPEAKAKDKVLNAWSTGTDNSGRRVIPNPAGIPSAKAADAFYKAADAALGLNDVPPEEGKEALRFMLNSEAGGGDEKHPPAWRLAAALAWENRIDLGIPHFNEADYAKVDALPDGARDAYLLSPGSPYAHDPTGGRAGSLTGEAAQEARRRRLQRADMLRLAQQRAPKAAPPAAKSAPLVPAPTEPIADDEPEPDAPDSDE